MLQTTSEKHLTHLCEHMGCCLGEGTRGIDFDTLGGRELRNSKHVAITIYFVV